MHGKETNQVSERSGYGHLMSLWRALFLLFSVHALSRVQPAHAASMAHFDHLFDSFGDAVSFTPSGEAFFAGGIQTPSNQQAIFVQHLTANDTFDWGKRYATNANLQDVTLQTSHQRLRLFSNLQEGSNPEDILLLDLNHSGHLQRSLRLGGSARDVVQVQSQRSNQHSLIAGMTENCMANQPRLFMAEVDLDGQVIQSQCIDFSGILIATGIIELPNGQLVLTGTTQTDTVMLYFNETWQLVWARTLAHQSVVAGLALASNENYLAMAGYSGFLTQHKLLLQLLSHQGDVQWTVTADMGQHTITDITLTDSNEVLLTGGITHTATEDLFIASVDQFGQFQWASSTGGQAQDLGTAIAHTADGFAVAGYSFSITPGLAQAMMIRGPYEGQWQNCSAWQPINLSSSPENITTTTWNATIVPFTFSSQSYNLTDITSLTPPLVQCQQNDSSRSSPITLQSTSPSRYHSTPSVSFWQSGSTTSTRIFSSASAQYSGSSHFFSDTRLNPVSDVEISVQNVIPLSGLSVNILTGDMLTISAPNVPADAIIIRVINSGGLTLTNGDEPIDLFTYAELLAGQIELVVPTCQEDFAPLEMEASINGVSYPLALTPEVTETTCSVNSASQTVPWICSGILSARL